MQFHFHANQSHFHKNGFALRLALKQRYKGTRKWPIRRRESINIGQMNTKQTLLLHLSCKHQFENWNSCVETFIMWDAWGRAHQRFVAGEKYANCPFLIHFCSAVGPLMETFDDFWRMIWEQMSSIIVMLTKLEERGRVSIFPSSSAQENCVAFVAVIWVVTQCYKSEVLRHPLGKILPNTTPVPWRFVCHTISNKDVVINIALLSVSARNLQ